MFPLYALELLIFFKVNLSDTIPDTVFGDREVDNGAFGLARQRDCLGGGGPSVGATPRDSW